MKGMRTGATPSTLEALQFADLPDAPAPGPGEITVAIKASSLNYHDFAVVSGMIPADQGRIPMSDGAGEIVAVGETFGITDLFSTLRERQEHIAVVLDEFGGMAGIVTMEDVIETLLGLEIVDETDATTDMRVLAQRHRARRAKALGALDAPEGADAPKPG